MLNFIFQGGIELEKLQEISNLLPEVIESEVQKPEESDFRKVELIGKWSYLKKNIF